MNYDKLLEFEFKYEKNKTTFNFQSKAIFLFLRYQLLEAFSEISFDMCSKFNMLIIVRVFFGWDLQCFVGYDETIKEWLAYCLTCINNNLVLKIWGVKFYYELKSF